MHSRYHRFGVKAALVAAVVVAGGLVFFFASRGNFTWKSLRMGGAGEGGEIDLAALSAGIGGLSDPASDAAGGPEAGTKAGTEAGTPARRYSHQSPGFSFELPAGFTEGSFTDENGETILVRGLQGAEFQIYITPQDEDFAVTKERIEQDLPGTVVRDAKSIRLDGAPGLPAATGLLFVSEDASLGATRELWFEYRGFLYQATSRDASGDAMIAVMGTWKFE